MTDEVLTVGTRENRGANNLEFETDGQATDVNDHERVTGQTDFKGASASQGSFGANSTAMTFAGALVKAAIEIDPSDKILI